MSKLLFPFFFLIIFCSCSTKRVFVKISNNSPMDRTNENVDLCLCAMAGLNPKKINVYNEKKELVPSQILYKGTKKPLELIFPISINSGTKSFYTIRCDKSVSNVDTTYYCLEKKREQNIFKWNYNDMTFSFNGNNLNCFLNNKNYNLLTFIPKDGGEDLNIYNFNRVEILDNGPICFSFVIYYDNILYKGENVSMTSLVDLDKKNNVSKITLSFYGKKTPKRMDLWLQKNIKIKSSKINISNKNDMIFYSFSDNSFKMFSGLVFPDYKNVIFDTKKILKCTIFDDIFMDYSFYFSFYEKKEKINNIDVGIKLLETKEKNANSLDIELIK